MRVDNKLASIIVRHLAIGPDARDWIQSIDINP
jgi:hypothetical protein